MAGLGARAGIGAGLAGGRSTWWSRRASGHGSWRGARPGAGTEEGEAEPVGAATEGCKEERLGRSPAKSRVSTAGGGATSARTRGGEAAAQVGDWDAIPAWDASVGAEPVMQRGCGDSLRRIWVTDVALIAAAAQDALSAQ